MNQIVRQMAVTVVLGVLSSVAIAAGDEARSEAGTSAPDCLAKGKVIAVDNDQALVFKETSRNAFRARAHVQGKLLQTYPDVSGHKHYQVQIGPRLADTIEVIYNQSFGAAPEAQPGAVVEACGDYITSNAPNGRYQASPDGAILHWVHFSKNTKRHDSGYVVIDGTVIGQ